MRDMRRRKAAKRRQELFRKYIKWGIAVILVFAIILVVGKVKKSDGSAEGTESVNAPELLSNMVVGTTDELKGMIRNTETVELTTPSISEEQLAEIRKIPHVYKCIYEKNTLTVYCEGGKHNVINLLDYMKSQDLHFGYVHSKLPTLNDVFLEITGKELRD